MRVGMARRRDILLAAATAGLPAAPGSANEAPGGGRPIRLVVPFPPGGAVDILGRLLAERLGPALNGTVVVENRAGAGGNIGADAVAKAPPDGGTVGLLCVVNAETARRNGWTDFPALLAWARANPDAVRMGSSGTGTTSHLTIEAVNRATGARITHVPYRGGGPAINDLLAGVIDMMFDVMPALMPHVAGGKFKPLAVSSGQRLPILPEVPGLAEWVALGLGDIDIQTWNAVMTARGTPEPVVRGLFDAVRAVAAQPELAERLR